MRLNEEDSQESIRHDWHQFHHDDAAWTQKSEPHQKDTVQAVQYGTVPYGTRTGSESDVIDGSFKYDGFIPTVLFLLTFSYNI